MKKSNRNYRTVFLWVLSLVVVLSMVFSFVASLAYARPKVTPTPTYALPTFTPTVAATFTPAPQASTPEPPKANPPAATPTPAG